jgi:hypothetical protein
MPPKQVRRQRDEEKQPGSKDDPFPVDDDDEQEGTAEDPIQLDLPAVVDANRFFNRVYGGQVQQPIVIDPNPIALDDEEELNIRTDQNDLPYYFRNASDSSDEVEDKRTEWRRRLAVKEKYDAEDKKSWEEYEARQQAIAAAQENDFVPITSAQERPRTPPIQGSLISRSPRISREMMPQHRNKISREELEQAMQEEEGEEPMTAEELDAAIAAELEAEGLLEEEAEEQEHDPDGLDNMEDNAKEFWEIFNSMQKGDIARPQDEEEDEEKEGEEEEEPSSDDEENLEAEENAMHAIAHIVLQYYNLINTNHHDQNSLIRNIQNSGMARNWTTLRNTINTNNVLSILQILHLMIPGNSRAATLAIQNIETVLAGLDNGSQRVRVLRDVIAFINSNYIQKINQLIYDIQDDELPK